MKSYRNVSALSLLSFSFITGALDAVEAQASTLLTPSYRLHAHLLLNDPQSALEEWQCLSLEQQSSLEGKHRRIEILCALEERSQVLQAWKEYQKISPLQLLDHRELLEAIAWMTVRQTCQSPSLLTRAIAILTAGIGNDSRGVQLIVEGLQSPHAVLRKVAAEIAGKMHDDCLQEAILERLSREWVWEVREALITAVGQMGIRSAGEGLLARIESPATSEEERIVSIHAYSALNERIEPHLLQRLLCSARSSVRSLACMLCIEHADSACMQQLEVLLEDPHPQVQASALQALGLCSSVADRKRLASRVMELSRHCDQKVMLTAAWFLAPLHPQWSLEQISNALRDSDLSIRHLAVGVLATLGETGLPLLQSCLQSKDLYVRVNAAMACLTLRKQQTVSGNILEQALTQPQRWMWREEGFFRCIVLSSLTPKEEMPDYPEAMNQLTRLEVLHRLAVVGHPYAQRAMKRFLQDSVWSITGPLTSLAIMEGDKEVLQQVYQLEKDPNPRVRVQAALVLSLWGKDPRSIALLEASYLSADHALKGMILEAVGRIGQASSLPFLLRALEEPSQQLRLIGAMALLSCLQQA